MKGYALQTYRHIYIKYNQDLCILNSDFLDFSSQIP